MTPYLILFLIFLYITLLCYHHGADSFYEHLRWEDKEALKTSIIYFGIGTVSLVMSLYLIGEML